MKNDRPRAVLVAVRPDPGRWHVGGGGAVPGGGVVMDEPTVIICWRHISERVVEKQHCPTCKSEQDFYCEFEEWYGWTVTCLNCGDRWMDGELCPRPFERGWRKASIEHARQQIARHGLPAPVANPTKD